MPDMREKLHHALPVGHRIGDYVIESNERAPHGVLGCGGFGITYLARDVHLNDLVAIKEYLPNELAMRSGATVHVKAPSEQEAYRKGIEDFAAEARKVAQLKHHNIVRVRSVMEANNTAYMVMDYEDGDTLDHLLMQMSDRPSKKALLRIVGPLLDALAIVHRENMVHRDIKPANIFIRRADHSPILLDFGAARHVVGKNTRSLTLLCSPPYSPFEQYQTDDEESGKGEGRGAWKLGPWTDIYALGAILYRAIHESDKPPPESPNRVAKDGMVSAKVIGKDRYDTGFLRAIDWALRMRPQDRPQSVHEWRRALFNDVVPWSTPRPLSMVAAIASVLVLSGLVWYLWTSPNTPAPGATWIDPVTGMVFVWVPGGTFQMGCGSWSDQCDNNEQPVHSVTVKGFWMGKYAVTQEQWQQIMGNNPSYFKHGGTYPVENVSWYDANHFIHTLNGRSNHTFQLPTEAEWEYACRSGGRQQIYCGDNDPDAVAWFSDNSGKQTHPVGQKKCNGLGLCDMSGNVWEWTCSGYTTSYDGSELRCQSAEDTQTADDAKHVYRGGSWLNDPIVIRATNRDGDVPNYRFFFLGLRLIKSAS